MGGGLVIYTTVDSPIGELLLLGEGDTLHGLHMQAGRHPVAISRNWTRDDNAFPEARQQLAQYFAGERTCQLEDIALESAEVGVGEATEGENANHAVSAWPALCKARR